MFTRTFTVFISILFLFFLSLYTFFFLFYFLVPFYFFFFFSSRRRHTRSKRDWSSDVCSSDLAVLDACRRPQWGSFTRSLCSLIHQLPSDVLFLVAVFPHNAPTRLPRRSACHRSEERRVGKECRSRWVRCV